MSRKFGVIDSGFWRSRKLRGVSDQAKLLCLYLITCQHGNSIGLFHLPFAYAQADLGWTGKQVQIRVSELVSKGILECDFDRELVRFVGWWGHNPIDNGKHAAAVRRQMEGMRCDSDVFRNHDKALAEYAAASWKPYLKGIFEHSDTGVDTGIHTEPIQQTPTPTPTPTPKQTPSETPPAGAVDLKALVFERGVAAFGRKGWTEKQARTFLGKAVGECSVGDVLEAVGKLEREDPVDPASFLRGLLKAKRSKQANGHANGGPDPKFAEAQRLKQARAQAQAEGLNPYDPENEARVWAIVREIADGEQRRTA